MATSYVTLPLATGYVTVDRIFNKLGQLGECGFLTISNWWFFRAEDFASQMAGRPRKSAFWARVGQLGGHG
jgi:hypothetical protein